MNNVLIYGNGKSRLDFKERKFENILHGDVIEYIVKIYM